jgi:hypothetical protein
MAYNQSQEDRDRDCGCIELDSPTQKKTINVFREVYCRELYTLWGEVVQLQERRDKLEGFIKDKTCWFIWTEKNFRIHRNLSLTLGGELLQTGDSIKENLKNYGTSNKNLAESLKKLVKTMKEVKTKAGEFQDAAFSLKKCLKDPCNCSQLIELGIPEENCKGSATPVKERPRGCKPEDIDAMFKELMCMPENLAADATSIYNSAVNTQGIQSFTNTPALESMNNELIDRIKKFDKQVNDNLKRAEGDLKLSQDDLNKSKKEQAKTHVELYGKRNDFEGIKDSVKFYCCSPCNCVVDDDNCKPRLAKCEDEICELCKTMKEPNPPRKEEHPNQPHTAR